jgi:hypothetical protein
MRYTKSPQTSKQWATALILKLFNVAWDQWEHRTHFDQQAVRKADDQIRQEFVTGSHQPPPGDRGLFKAGVKKSQVARPLDLKQEWIQHVQVARENWTRQAHPTWPPERQVFLRWLQQQPRIQNLRILSLHDWWLGRYMSNMQIKIMW